MPRIAVVQPALALGEVEANLKRLEGLIRSAHREHGPEVIVVPEGCTTPNVYASVLRTTVQPVDGPAFRLLTGLARELDCVIGGGFVARRGAHAYGTYVLAEPGGAAHLHDKDIPTAWEQGFYRGGDDDGVTSVEALGGIPVGLMSGWEWARMRTAARVRAAGVQLVLGGMCWPSTPTNWPGVLGRYARHEDDKWRDQARALPGRVARLVGAPVAHAAHHGPVTGATPMAPGLKWPTVMIGESQVCDRDGTILARVSPEDGEGHAAADVELRAPEPLDPIRDRFWIQGFSVLSHVAWHAMNRHGALQYRRRHARGGFPWQALPETDLPDEVPPGDAAASPSGAPAAGTIR